jgi:hypothetical protein
MASNETMTDELESILKETVLARSRYCPGICLEGQRKTTKSLSHVSGAAAKI